MFISTHSQHGNNIVQPIQPSYAPINSTPPEPPKDCRVQHLSLYLIEGLPGPYVFGTLASKVSVGSQQFTSMAFVNITAKGGQIAV